MKRKLLLFTLVLGLFFSLTACSKKEAQEPVEEVTSEIQVEEKSHEEKEKPLIRYAVMTGPTGVGSVNLIEKSKEGLSAFNIEETIVGSPEEIVSALVSGNLDMAVVPANLASVLYNKTEGKIQVLATNNLGVLYVVEVGDEIQSLADLRGKTILSTGKGATPETVFNYVMAGNNLVQGEDWDFDFKSEATEVAQNLISDQATLALLPEPMVTAVLSQNDKARVAINLEEEWAKLNDSPQITGVLVGRKEFIETIDAEKFLEEYKASIEEALENIEKTSQLLGKYNIIKAEVAKKSIANMNLYYMDKEELKTSMTDYLQILAEANPQSIGGSVPDEDFYYLGK